MAARITLPFTGRSVECQSARRYAVVVALGTPSRGLRARTIVRTDSREHAELVMGRVAEQPGRTAEVAIAERERPDGRWKVIRALRLEAHGS